MSKQFRVTMENGSELVVDDQFIKECIHNLPMNPAWVDMHLRKIRELVLAKRYNGARIAMREFGNMLGT